MFGYCFQANTPPAPKDDGATDDANDENDDDEESDNNENNNKDKVEPVVCELTLLNVFFFPSIFCGLLSVSCFLRTSARLFHLFKLIW